MYGILTDKQINRTDKHNVKASRQKHTQETTKLTKKNRTRKHKWKRAKFDHVQKKCKKPAEHIHSGI
jgi:hypothetical protein